MSEAAPREARSWRPTGGEWAILLVVTLLGLINLPMPFWGDQALFVLFARELDSGSVLYRDVWDVKQPGIYWFYWVAGRLFGFHEIGVHLLELLWLLALSWVLMRTGRSYLRHPLAVLCLPLLTVGAYYMTVRARMMTQVESLIALPIYLASWFSLGRPQAWRSRCGLFVSGLLGAGVASLKLLLTPIVGAFWLAALALRLREARAGDRLAESVRFLLPVLAGVSVPVLGYGAYLSTTGTLELVWWTWFVHPAEVVEHLVAEKSKAILALGWFARSFAPAVLLASIAVGASIWRRQRDRFSLAALLWLTLGLLLIAVQVMWWYYYLLLLAVPLGMLAAMGLDRAIQSPRAVWIGVVTCVLAAMTLPIATLWKKTDLLLRHDLAIHLEDRHAYQSEIHPPHRELLAEAKFIRGHTRSGERAYVFGNPALLHLADLRPAIAINGWTVAEWTPQVGRGVAAQLSETKPEYIFAQAWTEPGIRTDHPDLGQLFETSYVLVRSVALGAWYRRQPPPDFAPD